MPKPKSQSIYGTITTFQHCDFFLCPPGPVQEGGEGLGQPGLQVRKPLLTISLKNISEGGRVGWAGGIFKMEKGVNRSLLALYLFKINLCCSN